MSLDFFVKTDSWLHRLDPRVKLVLAVVLMVAAMLVRDFWLNLFLLVGMLLMLASAHIPANRFQWVFKLTIPVTIMIVILWPFFYHSGPCYFYVGPLPITLGGIIDGIAMAFRIISLCFACCSLLFATDQAKIVRACVKLGMPYKYGLTLAIALRYLPVFFGIITMVTEAQNARGLDIPKKNVMKKLKSYMPILTAMLIAGLRNSDNMSNALETRAFGASVENRTYYSDFSMHSRDWIAIAIIAIGMAAFTYFFVVQGVRLPNIFW